MSRGVYSSYIFREIPCDSTLSDYLSGISIASGGRIYISLGGQGTYIFDESGIRVSVDQDEVQSLTQIQFLLIYPNPVTTVLNIKSNVGGSRVKILNTLGNVVGELTLRGGQGKLDVSGYSKGVYFIHLQTDQRVFVERIVIE